MSILTTLTGLITKENKLTSNRVANFAYNETAYTTDDANGVTEYDPANNQNIPDKNATVLGINNTILNHGFRNQASTLSRMIINHFFGRVSYNLNKVNDIMYSLLNAIKDAIGEADGIAPLDANAEVPKLNLPKCSLIAESVTLSDTFDSRFVITASDVEITLSELSASRIGTSYEFSGLYAYSITYEDAQGETVTDTISALKSVKYVFDGNNWYNSALQAGDDGQPIGTITDYPSFSVPNNYAICDGRALSRNDYADLFNVIGETFGEGDGYTTFNIPSIPSETSLSPDIHIVKTIKLTNFKADFEYGVLDDSIMTNGNAWSAEKTATFSFDGVCNSAGSDSEKVVVFSGYHGTICPRKFTVTYAYANEYGDVTASSPTHAVLVLKNTDGEVLNNGRLDDCDSLGHYAGEGHWGDGDVLIYERVGTKAISTNTDVRQKNENYIIKSDGYIKQTGIEDVTLPYTAKTNGLLTVKCNPNSSSPANFYLTCAGREYACHAYGGQRFSVSVPMNVGDVCTVETRLNCTVSTCVFS